MAASETSFINNKNLVGGLEHVIFFHTLGTIIPFDEVHHFSGGRLKPPFPPFPSGGPDHGMDRGPFSRQLSTVRALNCIV